MIDPNKKITSEKELAEALFEIEMAEIAKLEESYKNRPPHEFSPEFEAKIQSLIEACKRHAGTKTVPIWDEETQRYI